MIAVRGAVIDPMLWAKKPRSHLAMATVFDEAKKGRDPRFIEIAAQLVAAGHATDGGQQVIRLWDGIEWVRV